MQYIGYSFENKEATIAEPFEKRFSIKLDLTTEKTIFMRSIWVAIKSLEWKGYAYKSFVVELMIRTGWVPEWHNTLNIMTLVDIPVGDFLVVKSFDEFLEKLEFFIDELRKFEAKKPYTTAIRVFGDESPLIRSKWACEIVKAALDRSKMDLGISFDQEKGIFYPSGAKLLDEQLVNENLKWLQDFPKVAQPYDKGLQFFLEARNDSKKLEEVVSNIYKALEAFSHIVCDNTNELTNNQEAFLKKIGLSKNSYYMNIFKNYLNYANKFRHAEGDPQYHPNLDYAEVETFVYLTGLFIRLGMEKLKSAEK